MSAIAELPNIDASFIEGIIRRAKCRPCLDTGIMAPPYDEIGVCHRCDGASQSKAGSMFFDKFVYREATGKSLMPATVAIARVLTHFRGNNPCPRLALEEYFGISERIVKKRIEELRKEWLLPIGSRKDDPNGYWFITTSGEFLEWHRRYRSQALTELATGYAVMRSNFPDLAGQGKFTFVAEFTNDLEEALRGQL